MTPQPTRSGDRLRVAPSAVRVWSLIAAVASAAAAIVLLHVPHLPDEVSVGGNGFLLVALLAVGFAVAERAVIHLPSGRSSYSVTLSEIPLVVGLFLVAPSYFVLARVVGALLPLVWLNRRSLPKLAFNVAQYAFQAAVVVTLFHLILAEGEPLSPRGWIAVAIAVAATDFLGTLLISLAIAAHNGSRPRLRGELLALGPLLPLINASFGIALVYVISIDWRAIWTLGVLVGVLCFAQSAHHSLRRRSASLEQISKFTGEIGGRLDVESASEAAVRWIGRSLTAEVVELTLSATFAGRLIRREVCYDATPTDGLQERARADVLRPWMSAGPLLVRRGTKDAALALAVREAGLRDTVAMFLHGDDGEAIGTLVVGDRLGDVETFAAADVRELQALGNHLSVALRNARRADLISEHAAAQLRESLCDPLTGLPNRRALEENLAERLAGDEPVGLILLDLSGFKQINETLGHAAGDALLQLVASRLGRSAPDGSVMARLGGDEFAVLLPDADAVTAGSVVSVLRNDLSTPFAVDDLSLTVGASFGMAFSDPETAVIDVLRRADVALSAAKARRTAVETYRPELDARSRDRLTLPTDLKRAIADGSLTVAFQPKLALTGGQVLGAEALARWTHPERGVIPPDDFIPVAEHSGLITPLTMAVLGQSLRACETWRRAGWAIGVAVNISPRSLLDPGFVDDVARVIAGVEVPASAVTLEITESSLMAEPERAIEALQRLRDLGVRLSIDDLGTGYSSLSYLQRLPVHEIKIDRSFLIRTDEKADGDSVAIIGAMVDLGHRLGRHVVAEGVEDEAAWNTLRSLGCDSAQGYWMSRPLPGAEFLGWLQSWKPANVTPLRALGKHA